MGRSSRQPASAISWDKMAEKAERDLEKGQAEGIERGKLGRWAM